MPVQSKYAPIVYVNHRTRPPSMEKSQRCTLCEAHKVISRFFGTARHVSAEGLNVNDTRGRLAAVGLVHRPAAS